MSPFEDVMLLSPETRANLGRMWELCQRIEQMRFGDNVIGENGPGGIFIDAPPPPPNFRETFPGALIANLGGGAYTAVEQEPRVGDPSRWQRKSKGAKYGGGVPYRQVTAYEYNRREGITDPDGHELDEDHPLYVTVIVEFDAEGTVSYHFEYCCAPVGGGSSSGSSGSGGSASEGSGSSGSGAAACDDAIKAGTLSAVINPDCTVSFTYQSFSAQVCDTPQE